MSGSDHLIVLPVVLPLVTTALLLLIGERRRLAAAAVSVGAGLALVVIAACLAWLADGAGPDGRTVWTYRLGDWPAAFGIVLVVDRLSALMVFLTAILGLPVQIYALGRWQRLGPHFLPLFQILLMGLNGAFLTGDLFNLFVFFEVLLAASYGLALHGSGRARVKGGLHYIVVNLAASLLFLIGASLIFGVTGTLNLATLAARAPDVADNTRALLQAGAALLAVAFLIKAAAWPMGLWLPGAYAAAAPPVAAMFAIMTKVGVYALMRLSLLVFGAEAGASAHLGADLLALAGAATLVVGMIGVLGAQTLGRMVAYNVLISAGVLLGAVGLADPAVTAGALFYLLVSTLSLAALFLLIGIIDPDPGDDDGPPLLEPYGAAEEPLFAEEAEVRVTISLPAAVLGGSFFVCTLLVVGLPPFSGFLAKLALLAPMVNPGRETSGLLSVALFVLILVSGLAALVALARAGVRLFWADSDRPSPPVRLGEAASMFALLLAGLLLTLAPEPVLRYLNDASAALHAPHRYVAGVLASPDPDRRAQP